MNKLKLLLEQRNTAVGKMDKLAELATKEDRDLNEQELLDFNGLDKQVRELEVEIKQLKEDRQKGGSNPEEEPKMNKKEQELRGLSGYLRKTDNEEVRTLQTTAQGAAIIPETIYEDIVKLMDETSGVFAKARKFPTISGSLKIPKEAAGSEAGFVGEGTNVAEIGIDLGSVKLTQRRVGAALALTQQFINDSAVDIASYSIELLTRRTVKAIENSMLTGVGESNDEFSGMATAPGVTEVEAVAAVTVDSLMSLYTSLHPAFLNGAEFVMSRTFFNKIALLKDGNNHFYLQSGIVNGRPQYTLFGSPVTVTDSLDEGALADEVPVIFVNVFASYAVMVKKGFELKHVTADTTQAMRGSQLLVLDGYMDGAVYNEQALSRLKIK